MWLLTLGPNIGVGIGSFNGVRCFYLTQFSSTLSLLEKKRKKKRKEKQDFVGCKKEIKGVFG
jgi:hypothetical protein